MKVPVVLSGRLAGSSTRTIDDKSDRSDFFIIPESSTGAVVVVSTFDTIIKYQFPQSRKIERGARYNKKNIVSFATTILPSPARSRLFRNNFFITNDENNVQLQYLYSESAVVDMLQGRYS